MNLWGVRLSLAAHFLTAMIDPTGDEKDKVYSNKIEFIITNDGTKYEFDAAPTLSNGAVVGLVKGSQVSIPVSDISKVGIRKVDADATTFAVLGGVAAAAALAMVAVGVAVATAPSGAARH